MANQIWTVHSILKWTQEYFQKNGIETARLDAEFLLASVLECSRLDIYLNFDKPLAEDERTQYREKVKRRIAGEPVAYLVGEKEFWNLTLKVSPGVLIPRPDTETLVETMVEKIQIWQNDHEDEVCQILELGTGTAAIPLALNSELSNLSIISIEISTTAINIASDNLKKYASLVEEKKNHISLIQGNKWEMLNPLAKFNFIVSNPPYIQTSTLPILQKDVTLYEPHEALDGGDDGLNFYRYLLKNSHQYLTPRGQMILEMGYDQEEALEALVNEFSQWEVAEFIQDIQSHPRVLHVRLVN